MKTLLWVLLAVFVAIFVMLNYGEPQRVKIWLSDDPVGFDWPVGIIALVFWLLGVIPTWLYHRSIKWSLGRRIRSLENSIKSSALSQRRAVDAAGAPVDKAVDKAEESTVKTGDTLTPSSDSPISEKPA
ncbi:MAG: LapA family protein [Pseudomonadota bacterium]